MKKLLLALIGFSVALAGAQHHTTSVPKSGNLRSGKSAYTITERGANHRVWSQVAWETNAVGRVKAVTNSYMELATGMHFKSKQGKWEEASEEIDILPNNTGAIADKGQHKVIFPPEIKSGLIELQTPDEKWMRSRVWGLAYFDSATGESVLLAEVKESEGRVVGDNVVIYPNAFTDFVADIRYTYTRAGFEQDVVLREQPPAPEQFGLSPQTTRLQVLTEFVEAEKPKKIQRQAGKLPDETLGFGAMSIGAGKAFAVDEQGGAAGHVSVAKQWGQLDGRDFLIEEVSYEKVSGQLRKLPAAKKYEGSSLLRRGKGGSVLAGLKQLVPKRYAKVSPDPLAKPKRMAKAALDNAPSFVMDYVAITSQTNFTFRGDTTYYVNGMVVLSGTTTIEGGAVVKFSTNSSAQILLWDGQADPELICKTEPYRMAVFTAKDDNSVGEIIAGSTGNPSGYYGGIAMSLWPDHRVKNVRVSYLTTAFNDGEGAEINLSNIQIVKCRNAFTGTELSRINVENGLITETENVVTNALAWNFVGEHLTIDRCGTFAKSMDTEMTAGSSFNLTNSLIVATTNWTDSSYVTFNTNATIYLSSGDGVFQTVGAGYHYLATNSPYRSVGTTNIDATLLASLKKKTTYPPVILTNTISTNTTLSPQAQRDTDIPDLGYHYDPIDYWTSCTISNATVTLTNGVVAAYFKNPGFWMWESAKLESTGTPTARNYLVYFSGVQEQPLVFDSYGLSQVLPINPYHTNQLVHPEVSLDFTTMIAPQGADYMLYQDGSSWSFKRLELRNCELYGGGAQISFWGGMVNASYQLINSLFEYNTIWIDSDVPAPATLVARNNLFRNAPWGVEIVNWNTEVWHTKDNVFDGVEFYIDNDTGHNAYVNGATAYSEIKASDIILTNLTWVAGPLGNYYQPSGSALINAGSRGADEAELYHCTVVTNLSGGLQSKETNSVVDIGYHYVAVNTNGNPTDSDGDGLPDYFEDANGDGSYNTGDLANWASSDSDGDGLSDYFEITYGFNPNIAATPDVNNQTKLQTYTPLK